MPAVDVTVSNGDTHAIGNPSSCRGHGVMRALTLVADRQLVVADVPAPAPPGAGEVQCRVKAVALNHIDDPRKLQIGQKLLIPAKTMKAKKTHE